MSAKQALNKITSNRKFIAAFLLVIVFVFYKIYQYSNIERTDNAYIEADISMISGEVRGAIKEILVADNQKVEKGQVLAKIDDVIYRAELQRSLSAIESAKYALDSAELNKELEATNLSKALEELEFRKKNFKIAEDDFQREKKLHKDKYSSNAQMDAARSHFEASKFELRKAELENGNAEKKFEIAKSNCNLHETQLKSAQETYRIALENLENTQVKSPIDGVLAQSNLRIGNYIQPGMPLVYVVPTNLYLKANFKETQVNNFDIGSEVTFKVDALNGKEFSGKVKSIYPATGAKFSLIPPDNATGNFTKIIQRIPVIIEFDNNQESAANLTAGMSSVVSVRKK